MPPRKRQKVDSDQPVVIHDRHTLERMNYLLHLARVCCIHACTLRHQGQHEKVLSTTLQCRHYIKAMRSLASKMTVPMTTGVKHTFCKQCNLFMFDGLSCQSKIIAGEQRDRGNFYYQRQCFGCGSIKRWRLSKEERSLVSLQSP